jgi:histidyl-tRNA synthetase
MLQVADRTHAAAAAALIRRTNSLLTNCVADPRSFLAPRKHPLIQLSSSPPRHRGYRVRHVSSSPSTPTSSSPLRSPAFRHAGTADLFSPVSSRQSRVASLLSSVVSPLGFEQIVTPILEPAVLYVRTLGSSSDIVSKELYYVERGQDEREEDEAAKVVLRPEGTAGVVRALIARGAGGEQQRLWYCGPMFRRQQPRRGRFSQFTQFGLELVAVDGVAGEVEALQAAWQCMQALRIDRHVQLELNTLGDEDSRRAYTARLTDWLQQRRAELSAESAARLRDGHVMRILDSKDEQDRRLIEGRGGGEAAPLLSSFLTPRSQRRFQLVLSALHSLSIPFTINPYLVRGLDYYTDTAFEMTPLPSSSAPFSSAVLAGGRYDALFSQLGGLHTACIGWALGIERALLLQDALGLQQTEETVVAMRGEATLTGWLAVVGIGEGKEVGNDERVSGKRGGVKEGGAVWTAVLRLLAELRAAGIVCQHRLADGKAGHQLTWAAKAGARAAVVVGEEELSADVVQVKDMSSREQRAVPRQELIAHLQSLLSRPAG